MSRMAVPTMDVVRFKEDDVIVASGGPMRPLSLPVTVETLTLGGFADGKQHNAFVIFSDGSKKSADELKKSKAQMWFTLGEEKVSAIKLHQHDKKGINLNGDYNYDHEDEDGTWWRHQ